MRSLLTWPSQGEQSRDKRVSKRKKKGGGGPKGVHGEGGQGGPAAASDRQWQPLLLQHKVPVRPHLTLSLRWIFASLFFLPPHFSTFVSSSFFFFWIFHSFSRVVLVESAPTRNVIDKLRGGRSKTTGRDGVKRKKKLGKLKTRYSWLEKRFFFVWNGPTRSAVPCHGVGKKN